MSISRPFLYLILIFMLHNRFDQHSDEQHVNAATIFSNGFDDLDAIDKDYEVESDDASERADIEQQDMNYVPERVMYKSTQETEEEEGKAVPIVRRAYNEPGATQQQVERSACGPPDPMDCRQDELNNALQETQDTIDHVSNLIKQMREHAIALIKAINELETDLLASCDDPPPIENCGTPEPPRNDDCNSNGNGYGNGNANCNDNSMCNNNGNNDNNNNCNNNNNNNCNDNNDNNCNGNGNNNGNGNCNGNGNGCGVTDDNSISPGVIQSPQLVPTQLPLVMNEWSAPVKNDVTQTQTSKDFMAEAQDAVRSWRAQIEACKQILDNAVAQAAQNSLNNPNQNQNYVYKPQPQANQQSRQSQQSAQSQQNPQPQQSSQSQQSPQPQQSAQPQQSPQSQQSSQPQQSPQSQRVQMAPSAAASITPVITHPTHPNVSFVYPKDPRPKTALLGKTNDLLYKLKNIKSDKRPRKFNGMYDQLRAKGSPGTWNLFN